MDFGKLPLYKLEKSIENRENIVNLRVERLRLYDIDDNHIRLIVNKAIDATKLCDELSQSYENKENTLLSFVNSPNFEKIEKVISFHRDNISRLGDPSGDILSGINEKAYIFIRNCVSGEYSDDFNEDDSMENTISIIYKDDPDLDIIKMVVTTLLALYDEQIKTAETAISAIFISRFWRGMLYAGFIDHYGGKLDKEDKIDALKDIAIESILSIIPYSGIAQKIVVAYKVWFDQDAPPANAKAANKVLTYLNQYISLMEMWYSLMPEVTKLMETCEKTLEPASKNKV